jgi:hypothetical protein
MVLTRNMNAKRLARMVLKPVVAGVSAVLFDYRTDSQAYSQCFPRLAGTLWRDVPFVFDVATVLGIFPADQDNELVLCPSPDYVMQACSSGMSGAVLCELRLHCAVTFAAPHLLRRLRASAAMHADFPSIVSPSGALRQSAYLAATPRSIPLLPSSRLSRHWPCAMQRDDQVLILRSSKFRPDQIVPGLQRECPSQGAWRPPTSAGAGGSVYGSATASGAVDSDTDRNSGSYRTREGSGSGAML